MSVLTSGESATNPCEAAAGHELSVKPPDPYTSRAPMPIVAREGRCSDGGPGRGTRPFCTISAAAGRAVAGDTVHVGAGTYREQVTVPSGVRFLASSRSAQIVGSDSLTSASWSPAGGNSWFTVLADTAVVSRLLRGITPLTRSTSVTQPGTDSWFLDASTHRLYVDLGGPAPSPGDALEAIVRQYGFVVRGDHGVTVQGFSMHGQGGAGILLVFPRPRFEVR